MTVITNQSKLQEKKRKGLHQFIAKTWGTIPISQE
jgi:hypothetical protein